MTRTTTDVLWRNAHVITLEAAMPRATALATSGDRLAAVGDEATCRAALGGGHQVVDLGGATVVPGFIDTHLHPIAVVYFDMHCDLRGVTSIDGLQRRLRTAADGLAADEWLVGLQLEEQDLAERRLPTRAELDAACPERPLVVIKHDGHSAAGNSRAFAAAGIDATTLDPDGGRIERLADGTPSGPCRESGARLLVGAIPSPSIDRLRATAARTFARIVACGITSAGVVLQSDAEGPGGSAGALEALAMQMLLDLTPFTTYAILVGRTVDAAVALRESPLHDPAAGRRVGGFKIFADGTFGSCTACMHEPFSDHPEQRGYLTLDEDEILRRMRAAHDAGLQICVHAIGDAAVVRCVELLGRLPPDGDRRHRIEHASIVPPALAARMAALGVAVSTQPLFIHSEKAWLHARIGHERARHVYPLRGLLDAGVLVGGASDAPVESTSVLHAIQCCVTREGFETQQAVTALEALRLFTADAARVQHEEHEKGTLVAGKRADFVVLGGDPLTVPSERIAGLRVLRTVVGGRTVHLEST